MTRTPLFGARSTADQVLAGIDLTGKHYLVTEGGSGIGLQTASALAANGGHVILMARTLAGARRACAEVGYHCSPVQCDLADLDSVSAAAAEVHGFKISLDAIVADAGIANLEKLTVLQGVEQQFFVNHIGHFALVNELTSLLREGSGRVVIVATGIAKFANALYAKELSRRLRSRGVTVNAVDPGAVRGTAIVGLSGVARLAQWVTRPFRRSPEQGAATPTLLAASPNASGVSGEFWRHCKIAAGNSSLDDSEVATRLWKLTEDIIARHRASGMLAQAA